MKTRIPSLDGIRAIAVTLVILVHYANDRGGSLFNVGSLGVRIFFVISGFLITTLLLKEIQRNGQIDLKAFYVRRTLRIFPPFYFYLAVMIALTAFGLSGLTFHNAIPAFAYATNYWNRFTLPDHTIPHTWSLATEEQFYLIWPVLFFLAGRKRATWVVAGVIIVSPILRAFVYFHAGHPTFALDAFHVNADHIGAGCFLALVRNRLHEMPAYLKTLNFRAFWLLPVFVFVANCQTDHPGIYKTVLLSLINVSIAVCIDWAITNHEGIVGRVLNSRPLTGIGVLSYSLYLWQQPFTFLHSVPPPLNLQGPWLLLANPAVSLLCIVACACFSYFVIEQPSLRFRHYVESVRMRASSLKNPAHSDSACHATASAAR